MMNEWISVDSGKPEPGRSVLAVLAPEDCDYCACEARRVIIARFVSERSWEWQGVGRIYGKGPLGKITHWQPLPMLPAKQRQAASNVG